MENTVKLALCVVCVALLVVGGVHGARPARAENLCYNGTFDSPEDPLAGWTYDYQWQGNSHYMQNHTRVSVEPTHRGKKNVLRINGSSETKVESKAIPFELGARYRCTLEMIGNTQPHIYFTGYKWQPGIRPYPDPHLGDLRRIYKSTFRGHKVTGSSGGWRRVTFEFPMENLSDLAMKHLRYVRFFTVYIIVIADAPGEIYVDNVQVTRIK